MQGKHGSMNKIQNETQHRKQKKMSKSDWTKHQG
jgi:hypothetical protein